MTASTPRKTTRRVYDPETRAAAMAALLAGQSVTTVAAEYRLPHSTVSRWRADARRGAARSDDVGALLLDYLRENLTTLRAQAVAFRDPEWLRTQDASAVGVLHGVLTDKAVRLLEALDGAPIRADNADRPDTRRRTR
jgi:transposase-like protein